MSVNQIKPSGLDSGRVILLWCNKIWRGWRRCVAGAGQEWSARLYPKMPSDLAQVCARSVVIDYCLPNSQLSSRFEWSISTADPISS